MAGVRLAAALVVWLGSVLMIPALAGAQTRTLTVAVLVNPTNASGFAEYQRYPERYLEHLQMPYETINVATTSPPAALGDRQLIVAGHRGLNLSSAWRTAIVNAVQGGTGFLNLDWDDNIGAQSHIQTLFGATGSVDGSGGNAISVPAAVVPDGATPHYIAGLQVRFSGMPAGQDLVYPLHDLNLAVIPTVLQGAQGTVIARVGGDPLILARDLAGAAGRVVHFGSYEYLKADRFGFLLGIDDFFWRSAVWAARKPFVLRGYPRLFSVQLDDTIEDWVSRTRDMYDPALTGPVNGDGTGGPWAVTAYVFTDRLASGTSLRAQMNTDVAAGQLQVSPHAFSGDPGPDMYYKIPQTSPPTDAEWLNNVNSILSWIEGAGGNDRVPSISKAMLPHWWTLADNTGYDLWNALGFRYVTLRQKPGVPLIDQCCPDPAGRISGRPFRLYEMPDSESIDDDYPLFYADDITINSRAGLPPQTFTLFTTSVNQINQPGGVHRVDFAWPSSTGNDPTWNVAKSLDQLERWTWRLWSSQAPVNLYTHDSNNLVRSTIADRQGLIQQGSQWLNQHGVFHVYMEELGAYIHARTKSRLTQGSVTGSNLSLTFAGDAVDADGQPVTTSFYVFLDDDDGALRTLAGFSGGTTFGITTSGPGLAVAPASLAFVGTAGDNPPSKSLQITNAGFGLLSWSVADDASWLTVSPDSGTGASTLQVGINTSGLSPGDYSAAITVTAPGATGSPQTIPVTLHLEAAPAPSISRISPTVGSAAGGDLVQILGTGLGAGTVVRFGGTVATVSGAQGNTSLLVTTPPGAEGVVDVQLDTPGGTVIAPDGFTYVPATDVLLIDAFSDGNSNGWTVSPLGGAQFWTASSGTLVYSGAGHTQLYTGQGTWSDYTVEGRFRLSSLSNFPGGLRGRVDPSTGTGYEVWLYPASSEIALFRVTGWSIDSPGLTELGRATAAFDVTNFHAIRITFSGSVIEVAYDGDVKIIANDSTYASGGVAIDVSNQRVEWDDIQVLTSAILPPPTITRLSPPAGSTAAGTVIAVEGSSFTSGATVTVGGTPATNVTVVGSTRLQATAPAGTVGLADVVVTTGSGSASRAYRYLPAETILFQDTFNDGNFNGWSASPLGGQSLFNAGSWFLAFPGGQHTQLQAGDGSWSDYTVEAKFRLQSLQSYPGGLRGRVNPGTGAGYEAWLLPASGEIVLFRVGSWSIDGPSTVELGRGQAAFDAVDFHTLALSFEGNQIRVIYDGTTVVTATDSVNGVGAIAIDVSSQPVHWDDILVTGPSSVGTPTIDRVSPTDGSSGGGTLLQIDGTGFLPGTTVTVGGSPATSVNVISSSRIRALTPAGTAGPAQVVVSNTGGSASVGFNYVAAAQFLLGDPFNDGDLAGWTISPLGNLAGFITGGGTLDYNGGGHTQLYAGRADWTDYAVEGKLRLSTLSNYPGGLRGRVDPNTGSGYEVWLYPEAGEMALFRVTGWAIDSPGLAELGRATVTFDNSAFHRLRLEFAGATITVFYDGAPVITATDATYPAGAVALDVASQPVQWDDVLVVGTGQPSGGLQVLPLALSFFGVAGNPLVDQGLTISHEGEAPLNFTASANQPWVQVTPASGTTPGSAVVSVNTAGVAAGSHTATVTIDSPGVFDAPKTITVSLSVTAAPQLTVTPLNVGFTSTGAVPPAQTVGIANGGGGALSWTRTVSQPWITATPASGGAPASVSISVNPAGLPQGVHTGTVTFDAGSGVAGSPQTVNVTLTVPFPDLLITAVSNPPASIAIGETFSVTDITRNQGGGASPATITRFYLSVDAVRDAADVLLSSSRSVEALGGGSSSQGNTTVTVPATPFGTYRVLACADDTGGVTEASEANNCAASAGAMQVVGPDLQVTAGSNPPATALRGGTFSVTDTTSNLGARSTGGSSTTRHYLSTDQVRNAGDTAMSGTRSVTTLAAGAASSGTVTVTVPSGAAFGVYFLLSCADDNTTISEQDETNNCRASATTVQVTASDLVVTAVSNPPATSTWGGTFSMTDTTRNNGTVSTGGSSTTRYYLSVDQARNTGDISMSGTRSVSTLAAGTQSSGTVTVTMPSGAVFGTPYFVLACADDNTAIIEVDETNNCGASTTTIQVTAADLVVTSVSNPPATSTRGGTFSMTDTTRNSGAVGTVSSSTTRYYLSADQVRNTGDVSMSGTRSVTTLLAGAQSSGTVTVTVPSGAAFGTYFLLACADDNDTVDEASETNNCTASTGTVQILGPDLVVTAVSNPPAAATWGNTFSMTDTTRNSGAASTGSSSTTRFYLSTDQARNTGDLSMSGTRSVTTLAAGAQSSGTVTVTMPSGAVFGTAYFVLACADDNTAVGETDELNNCASSSTTVQVTGADLVVTAVGNPPATAARGGTFSMTDTTRNDGSASTGSSSTTRFYLSTDQVRNSGDLSMSGIRTVTTLAAGTQSAGSVTVTVPTGAAFGTSYFVLACADDNDTVDESNEGNNCLASAGPVQILGPDLQVTAVSNPPATAARLSTFTVTDTTRNDGAASTGSSSTTRFYLSTDQVRNSGDLSMSGVRTVTTLAAGTQSAGSVTVTVPTGAAFGTSYFVLACADDNDTVDEINEGNNCLASAGPVQILGPDLQVTAVSNPPATADRGSTFTVTDTTRNNGAATTGNSSSTRYYFSTDTSLSSGDRRLTGTRSVATLSAGTQSSGSVSVQVPTTTTSGQYWLLACADDQTDVDEVNESNNCLASTTRVTVP